MRVALSSAAAVLVFISILTTVGVSGCVGQGQPASVSPAAAISENRGPAPGARLAKDGTSPTAVPRGTSGPVSALSAQTPRGTAMVPSIATPGAAAYGRILSLEVTSPPEDIMVDQAILEIEGRTVKGAVVSVNGDAVPVKADGSFTATITLEEGANSVEVVASDLSGNEAAIVRSVIYEP